MPQEYYSIAQIKDLSTLRVELNRILDKISRRLNFLAFSGDDFDASNKKFKNLAAGVANTDAVRVDQSFLISQLSATILGTTDEITVTVSVDNIATISLPNSIKLDGSTASLLLATDANKKTTSVTNLASWIAGTTNQITVTNDGDGTVTISIPSAAIITLANEGLKLLDTNASHSLVIKPGSDLTAERILTITTGDAARTITLSGNPTLADWFDQAVKQASSPSFSNITSTVAIGTQPYACTSTTKNTNLNADTVDGKHDTDFETSGAAATVQSNLDAHAALTGSSAHGLGTISTKNTGTTAGPYTTITSITVVDGIVTDLQGS